MASAAGLSVVILAAGQGTRMKSRIPKVLHPIANKPMLSHVIDTARNLQPKQVIVVYGHGGDQVRSVIDDSDIIWKKQQQQLGTGHAVEQAMPAIEDDDNVLVLYGDVPLVRTETLADLTRLGEEGFGLLTIHLSDPTGYGRIVRDVHGKVEKIVEEKDANAEQRAITEINTGILCTRARKLRQWLRKLENNNSQDEYYLTDIIAMSVNDGIAVQATHPDSEPEVAGVNSRQQLAALEREYQKIQATKLMQQGVTIIDPDRIDIRGKVEVGQDIILDANIILQGNVVIGDNVKIDAGCVITDSVIGENVHIKPMSVIEQTTIGAGAIIGPFARLRPGTRLAEDTRVGNFVEIKNSEIDIGSKINHLSYIGDTSMGSGVNIGAGTITCNYDGANKHRTKIGDRVFIGSDTQLVAPVEIGDDATIGAGSTVTKDAPGNELSLSRSKQLTIKGWKKPTKK